MTQQFIWADDAGTVRIAWDGRDGYAAYSIETMEIVEEFTVEGAYGAISAREIAAAWWNYHGRIRRAYGGLPRPK